MPTSPVKTRIPLTSFGHLITEVKVSAEFDFCMSSLHWSGIKSIKQLRKLCAEVRTPLTSVLQEKTWLKQAFVIVLDILLNNILKNMNRLVNNTTNQLLDAADLD